MEYFLYVTIAGKFSTIRARASYTSSPYYPFERFPVGFADGVIQRFDAKYIGTPYHDAGWYLLAPEEHAEILFDLVTAGIEACSEGAR